MKKITLIKLFIVTVGILFAACKSDITQPVVSSNPGAPAQSDLSLTTNFVKDNADSLITFKWDAANFGFEASITYSLQVSPQSDFSADVVKLFSTQSLTGTASIRQVDNILLGWGKEAGTATNLYYRVVASVTDNIMVYSDVKSKQLTPFKFQLSPDEYTIAYVPGSYQGWSPGNPDGSGRIYSYNADSKFEGILRLDDGTNPTTEFKITVNPNWNGPNYGGNLTKTGNNYSGNLDPNGNNFLVNAACYKFNVDVNALTIALTKTDDWGIIGSAIPPYDWSADVNLFYDGKYQVWTITGDFKAGEFKFRANNAWDLNYGSNNNDGTLQAGGNNIPLAADGNYTIKFDPVALTYTVTKN
jgi:hypothetical protein